DFHVTGVQTCALPISVTSEGGQRIPTLMEALAETARPRVVPLLADVASAEAALAADAVAAEHSFTEHMLYSGPVEALQAVVARRSEERRVGKECGPPR